jgi:hypothetical protein
LDTLALVAGEGAKDSAADEGWFLDRFVAASAGADRPRIEFQSFNSGIADEPRV